MEMLLGRRVEPRVLERLRHNPLAHSALERLAPAEVTLLGDMPSAWRRNAAKLLMVQRPADQVRWAVLSAARTLWAWRAGRGHAAADA